MPDDVDVDVSGNLKPDAFAAVAGCPEDQLGRNDPRLEDLTVVIDVVNEKIERPHPLLEPALDAGPIRRRRSAGGSGRTE